MLYALAARKSLDRPQAEAASYYWHVRERHGFKLVGYTVSEQIEADVLRAVGEKTGVPAVVNTSLNEPGRPTATTPREAIGSLYTTGLDALALGPFLLAK